MLSYTRPQRRQYGIAIGSLVIVDILDVTAPVLIMFAINAATAWGKPDYQPSLLERLLPDGLISPESAYHGMWVFALAYFIAVGLAGYFRFWMSISISRATIGITNGLRERFYAHIQRLPASWHDRSTVGNVMSLATNDMDACRLFWGMGLLLLGDVVLYLLLTPAMMLAISPELTLMCLLPVPLIPWAISRVARRVEQNFERVQAQFSALSDRASEAFNGVKVIKSFAAEEQEAERFAELAREYRRRALRLARWQGLEEPLLVFFLGLTQIVVLAYGGWLVLEGQLAAGSFVGFFFLVMRLAFPMMELGMVIALFQRAIVSRRRIESVLEIDPEIASPDAPQKLAVPTAGRIDVRDLTYTYPGAEQPSLSGISLTIEPGRVLGIVGEVGSGKSTLLSLIPRLYDPPAGTIFIDGTDVRQVDLSELRGSIAAVPQETFLFSESILENIQFGLSDAVRSDTKAKSMAQLARVEDDILAFPRGYDTLLGERGVNLSGGQKQRVAIARALACEPAVLMLDDCLSAVDSQTEEAILRGLRGALRRQTSLIVSHRVSSVKDADHIIVLERGRIIEQGNHSELVALGGWYADLCRKQAMEAELD